MADFHQTGVVTTLHRLGTRDTSALERELEGFARRRRIALVLPCLFAEFSRPAIRHIVDELRQARYIDTVVVSLGKTTADNLPEARRVFARLPQKVRFIWNDGPGVQAIYEMLNAHGMSAGPDGKGRSCWIAYGYLLTEPSIDVIVSHDCDITTYSRELLARLCYPVVNPSLGFDFAKGYYARTSSTMNGRLTRLFVTPIIRALQTIAGPAPLLGYLDSFRYALSGEFAMTRELARANRIPSTWGLEIGVLSEIFRNCGPGRICQTELCANYDHKHQAVSAGDPGQGLLRMSIEVGQTLLRALAAEGMVFSEGLFDALVPRYIRAAEDAINAYEADALINGLLFDRHREEEMVGIFSQGLRAACVRHRQDPLGVPVIPSWKRVGSAVPDAMDLLRETVEEDSLAMAAA